MGSFTGYFSARRRWLRLLPLAIATRFLPGQQTGAPSNPPGKRTVPTPEADAPETDGKLQRDERLQADYDQNLKDARELMDAARSFELELEKSDRFVLSLGLLKKLDDMDKITKRIRNRMRH